MNDLGVILQALVERELSPAFVLDSSLRYLAFNHLYAAALLRLYAVDLCLGMTLDESICQPDDLSRAHRLFAKVQGGQTVVEEGSLGGHSPEADVYRITLTPLGPVPGLVLATATNITVERLVEASAQRQAQLFAEALDTSDFAYWSYDGDTGETFFSRGYYEMLGYEPGAFPMDYETWISLIHPDDIRATTDGFRSFFQAPDSDFHLEYRMRTAKNGWRWILGKGRVTERDTRGLPRRVAGVNLDITQRRLIAQTLTESEARWNSLVDGAPVGIALLGRSGLVQFVNAQHALFSNPWSVGRSWKEFLPASLHGAMDQILQKGFEQGESSLFRSHRKNLTLGSHYEHHVGPVNENGRIVSLMVVTVDVTDHVRGEIRRNQATVRQQLLLEANQDGLLDRSALLRKALLGALSVTDSQLSYLYFHSAEQKTFALHSCEGGNELWPVESPLVDLKPTQTAALATVVATRRPLIEPSLLVVPILEQGRVESLIAVVGKASPYTEDDASELQALADGFWMILSRRDAQQTLVRLSQAVEHSPVALLITDPRGLIEYANPRFSVLSGYLPSEVPGKNLRFVQSGLTRRAVYHELGAAIRNRRDWQGEIVNRRKNGELYTVLVSISPVLDPSGEISHFISINEDITVRKAAQELLARAGKMETIGTLAAGVAHDFNNLLTSVLGFSEMLLRKLEPGDRNRVYAEKIEISGRRAAQLVSSLLAVGRQQRLTTAVVNLGELLHEDEPLLASLVKPPLRFVCDLGEQSLQVEVDPGQLGQVVVNLVSNARDALVTAGTPGTITLTVGAHGQEAWFCVADDGPGIPAELQERVFDPFFTTKAIGKGTGLGLSIVQGIVQQHGGRIELSSSPGQGALFTVYLPRKVT